MCSKLLDKGNMKQWRAARDAERVMRDIPRKMRDNLRYLLHRKRIFVWNELIRTRSFLDHTDGMPTDLVLRIAVSAVEIAALKAQEHLPAADVLSLALNRRENLDDILVHFSPSRT